ncbi:helix-turn-helix domain-containing protein [Streptomyces avermitilis]
MSSGARTALEAEWARCRWIWNECVAKSRAVHLHNRTTGEKGTCGPAQLDRMLTGARERTPWLREGGSVPQQQLIRDFGKSRAKAHKDVRERLPQRQRAGMPRWKKKREALPTLNYTRRGFRLKDGRLSLAGGIVLTVVWSHNLPAEPSSVRVYQREGRDGRRGRSRVLPSHRDGGQAQYLTSLVPDDCQDERLAEVLVWAREHLHEPLPVAELARRAVMSKRSFARRFAAATGTTPHAWLRNLRLSSAEELLETTDLPIEEIAHRVGYGSAAVLREQFVRRRGVPPRSYRRSVTNAP